MDDANVRVLAFGEATYSRPFARVVVDVFDTAAGPDAPDHPVPVRTSSIAGLGKKPLGVGGQRHVRWSRGRRSICDVRELAPLLKGSYEHVVFYGHGYVMTRGGRTEINLATACGKAISAQQFADALGNSTGVVDVLIAGCNSNAFAADLTTRFPKIRFGGIQASRVDTIRGNAKVMTHFQIETNP